MSSSPATRGHFPPVTGWRFLCVYIALFVPFAVATPYLQKLLALRGFAEDQIGFILGAFELMAVIAPPVWGMLSDRCGRPRLVLALCVVGMIPAFLLFGWVSTTVGAIAVAVLFGLFYRPMIPLTDGMTFRFINRHGGNYGKVRIGGSLAFIIALLALERIGIGQRNSVSLILKAMVGAGCIQLASLWLIPDVHGVAKPGGPEPTPAAAEPDADASLRDLFKPAFCWFLLCAFLGRFAMMSYYGFFTLYLKEVHGVESAGYIWLIGPLSEIPIIYFSGPIMDRIGVRNLFALGILGCAVRFTGFGLAPGLWLVVPLQLLHSLTFGAYHCSGVTYVSRIVPHRLQSTAQTFFAAVTIGGGGIIGGAVGGIVARYFGFQTLYLSFGMVAAVTLVILMVTVPSLEHAENASTELEV